MICKGVHGLCIRPTHNHAGHFTSFLHYTHAVNNLFMELCLSHWQLQECTLTYLSWCWVSINYLSFIFCLFNEYPSSCLLIVSFPLCLSSSIVPLVSPLFSVVVASVLSCCLILLYFGNRISLYISCSFTSHLLSSFWMPSLLPVSLPISLECIHSLPLVWSVVYLLFVKCFSFCSLSFVPLACISVTDSLLKTFWLYLSHKFSIALIYI